MRPSRARVSADEMLHLSEAYLPHVTRRRGYAELRRRQKITVEFVLEGPGPA